VLGQALLGRHNALFVKRDVSVRESGGFGVSLSGAALAARDRGGAASGGLFGVCARVVARLWLEF
jgi:hypothetical protein